MPEKKKSKSRVEEAKEMLGAVVLHPQIVLSPHGTCWHLVVGSDMEYFARLDQAFRSAADHLLRLRAREQAVTSLNELAALVRDVRREASEWATLVVAGGS